MDTDSRLRRISRGRTDLILEVLAEPANGPLPEVDGASLAKWAAYYGDVTALRCLVGHGESILDLGDNLGLLAAAFHGHWRLAEFLIEQGADPNRADGPTGETPLHAALANDDRLRYDLVVAVLLAAGADPCSTTLPSMPTGSFMRDCRTRGEGPLHRAAAFGSPDTIHMLLSAGADLAQRDAHGDTPLSWASWYRRPAAVLRLLLHGEHRIHPDYQPLRANLLGAPLC